MLPTDVIVVSCRKSLTHY